MTSFNCKGKRTYNVSEIQVGDIVKFKGTRNKGFRRIIKKSGEGWSSSTNEVDERYKYSARPIFTSFFSQVLNQKMSGFSEQPYTSTNSVDKLSHVFKEGNWFKVIKD